VLLVEDMDDPRESCAWLLRHAGDKVLTTPCGFEALPRLQKIAPEFVLTDFMMPRMRGVEFIRRLRLMPELDRVPRLMVTANS